MGLGTLLEELVSAVWEMRHESRTNRQERRRRPRRPRRPDDDELAGSGSPARPARAATGAEGCELAHPGSGRSSAGAARPGADPRRGSAASGEGSRGAGHSLRRSALRCEATLAAARGNAAPARLPGRCDAPVRSAALARGGTEAFAGPRGRHDSGYDRLELGPVRIDPARLEQPHVVDHPTGRACADDDRGRCVRTAQRGDWTVTAEHRAADDAAVDSRRLRRDAPGTSTGATRAARRRRRRARTAESRDPARAGLRLAPS